MLLLLLIYRYFARFRWQIFIKTLLPCAIAKFDCPRAAEGSWLFDPNLQLALRQVFFCCAVCNPLGFVNFRARFFVARFFGCFLRSTSRGHKPEKCLPVRPPDMSAKTWRWCWLPTAGLMGRPRPPPPQEEERSHRPTIPITQLVPRIKKGEGEKMLPLSFGEEKMGTPIRT